jgi:hypothetical protein
MTGPAGLPGTAEKAIRSYLAELADSLPGPAGVRRDIVAELGAGLADAADAYRSGGLDPACAARAAIAEFGHPDQVAVGFRSELAAAQARRTALIFMTTGPLSGLLWAIALLASHIGVRFAPAYEWAGLPGGAQLAIHVAVVILAVAIGSTFLTLATTGRLTRWLPARPAAAAAVAAAAVAAVDITLLTMLTILAASTPGRLAALPLAAAAAASLTRLGLATRAAARNCLAIRAPHPRVGG